MSDSSDSGKTVNSRSDVNVTHKPVLRNDDVTPVNGKKLEKVGRYSKKLARLFLQSETLCFQCGLERCVLKIYINDTLFHVTLASPQRSFENATLQHPSEEILLRRAHRTSEHPHRRISHTKYKL
ncbi:hypothetical protein SFRURICE_007598 [Spodoptera frugiperda]|nr:hypothetical protein SFRURICE_007598 [Spodoptera frugiperda]